MRILHISDLHVTADNRFFFEQLSTFLTNELKGVDRPDFIVISGDLGDRAEEESMAWAANWVAELSDALNVDNSHVITCAGNHDLNTKFVENNHSDFCLHYETGNDYISSRHSTYPKAALSDFIRVTDKFQGKSKKINDFDMIVEFDDIRFIVLNSSLLSSIKKEKRRQLEEELAAVTTNKKQFIRSRFNGVLVSVDPASDGDLSKNCLFPSYNFSENSRQQINDVYENILKNIDDNDSKINALILHHPEFCMHFLQRYSTSNIGFSGSYSKLSSLCDLVICGHIHPNTSFSNNRQLLIMPHLVGGKCNPKADMKEEPLGRPIFFTYDFDNKKKEQLGISCKRKAYRFKIENGNYVFYPGDTKNVPIDPTIPIVNETATTNNAQNEGDLENILEKFAHLYIENFVTLLKDNGISTQAKKIDFWYPNNIEFTPHYYIHSNIYEIEIEGIQKLYIDLFPSHLMAFPNYLNCRLDRNFIVKERDCNYVPIAVDYLYSSMHIQEERKRHFLKIDDYYNDFYSTEHPEITALDVYLANNVKKFDNYANFPNIFKTNRYIILETNIVNALIGNHEINFADLKFDYNTGICNL